MDGRCHVQQLRIRFDGTQELFCSAGLSPSDAVFVCSQLAQAEWQLNRDLIISLMDAPLNHLLGVKPVSSHHKLMSGFPVAVVC